MDGKRQAGFPSTMDLPDKYVNDPDEFALDCLLAHDFPPSLKQWTDEHKAIADSWIRNCTLGKRVRWKNLAIFLPPHVVKPMKNREYHARYKRRRQMKKKTAYYEAQAVKRQTQLAAYYSKVSLWGWFWSSFLLFSPRKLSE